MADNQRILSYREFWPHYLREHAKPRTRYIHYCGTGLVLLCLIAFSVTRDWIFLILAPFAGYGPAWFAHFFVEKNKPATFRYPLWSVVSDFRMFFTWLAGSLPHELIKAGVSS